MLVLVDSSIAERLAEEPDSEFLHGLESFANSIRVGYNNVYGERSVIESIANSPNIDKRHRACFGRILSSLTFNYSSLSKIDNPFVVYSSDLGVRSNLGDRRRARTVEIRSFAIPERCSPPILLCENASDAALYKGFAKHIAKVLYGVDLRIEATVRGGGGNTTYPEYKRIANAGRHYCFCIVDSDVRYPGGSLGDTARQFQNDSEGKTESCDWMFHGARNIECLIPIAVYQKIAQSDHTRKASITSNLAKLSVIGVAKKRYLDMKRGLKKLHVDRLTRGSAEYLFYQEILDTLIEENKLKDICVNPICLHVEGCSCSVFVGNGRILDATVEIINEEVAYLSNLNHEESWLNTEVGIVGRELLPWVMASEPART
jgi:hypothetical protein